MIQFDVHIFQMGWNSTTKTRYSDLCFLQFFMAWVYRSCVGGCELALPYELAEPNLTQCPEDLTHVVKVSQCLLAQFFPFLERFPVPLQTLSKSPLNFRRDTPAIKQGGHTRGHFNHLIDQSLQWLKLLRESPGLGYEAGDIFGLKYGGHIASHEHPYGCFKNLEDNYITCLSEVPKGTWPWRPWLRGFWMFFDVWISFFKLHLQDSNNSRDLRFNHRVVCLCDCFSVFFGFSN